MGVSFVAVQQACLHSAEIAQSSVAACQSTLAMTQDIASQVQSISEQIRIVAENSENHISHVISVFSELALGVSSVELFDPLKWRERANKISSDAIGRDELLSSVKRWGKILYFLTKLATSPRWGWIKFYLFPILSVSFACIALFGLLFHWSEYWLLGFAVFSFLISVILPIVMTAGVREEHRVDVARKTTIV